jgi:hypothetical protein
MMLSNPTIPNDDMLIRYAALSLRLLWEDEKRADRVGDRIEQDLWRLKPKCLSPRGRGHRSGGSRGRRSGR